jgi:hypothetical protein
MYKQNNIMAALKTADMAIGLASGFIGGGLLTGAFMASRSNTLVAESARLATVQMQKIDDAEADAEIYKQLYRKTENYLQHLEAENKKLKSSGCGLDVLFVSSVLSVASYTLAGMMK